MKKLTIKQSKSINGGAVGILGRALLKEEIKSWFEKHK
jgi:hypothetical protein